MGTLSCGYQKLLLKSKSHVNNLKDLSLHYLQAVTWLQAVVAVQKSFIDSLPYNLESPREVLRSIISFNLELYEK